MYALAHGPLSYFISLLFFGVGSVVAPAPAAVGSNLSGPPVVPTTVPTSPPTPTLLSASASSATALAEQALLGGVPSGLRSDLDQRPLSTPGCFSTSCIEVYPSVTVFYWPSKGANTACLSTLTEQPTAAPQPSGMYDKQLGGQEFQDAGLTTYRISPSIYVVLPGETVYDLCGISAYFDPAATSTTLSYDPSDVSTLQAIPGAPPATQLFNSNDLPCPPPAIAEQLDPGSAYSPVLVETFFALTILPQTNTSLGSSCGDTPISQDPPRPVLQVNAITGPGQGVPP